MIARTQEGLIGANNAMNVIRTPMKVFYEARARGDKATMDRAMGYASEINEDAWEHKYNTDEALKQEAEENKAKAQQEAEALARRIEESIEENRDKLEETTEDGSNGLHTLTGVTSEENAGQNPEASQSEYSAEKTEPADNHGGSEPVTYDKGGKITAAEPKIHFNITV